MIDIKIFTTKGCTACEINEKLVLEAIKESSKSITVGIIDCCSEYYKDFIKENNITDFPTTLFIKDHRIVDRYVGTTTKNNILNKIKYWL